MNSVYDTEVVFSESFAPKPVRTFVVNTNAPLHSINTNIASSSGVFTFPADSQFPDRFILWRAIGQKLFLEERSLCRTVLDGTLCLDFSRTAILPSCSVALFDQNVLCIVVPTQSTIHRFYARLVYDPTEMVEKGVSSTLSQINEKEFLVDNHTSYQLVANSHAFRSSVIQQPDLTRIAFCMTEGQLVVVTMYANKYDKVEEVVFREYGLMKRLLGEAFSGGVSDVSGLAKIKKDQTFCEDMFYAVYHDGTVRAWNAETQRVMSADVCKSDPTMGQNQDYLNALAVKAYQIETLTTLVVAVSTAENTQFHFIYDQHAKLTPLFTVVAENNERLLDFGIVHRNTGPRFLWALWNSTTKSNEYILKYIDIDISPKRIGKWRKVYTYSTRDPVSPTMTVAELKESIFNVDIHPFDIVFRSVQIACQGARCECSHGDWVALTTHVDSYLRSPEFDSAYTHRAGRQLKLSSSDAQADAEQRFFYSLASTCHQLEQASRGPLGLFLLDMPGAFLTGVIQQDRFSVVLDGEKKLIDEVESCTGGAIQKTMTVAMARATAKEIDCMGLDEYEDENGPLSGCTALRTQSTMKTWNAIINIFLESVTKDISSTGSSSDPSIMFDGSFVCGLIASRLRHVVQQRLTIARSLLAVVRLYAEDNNRVEHPVFDFPYLEEKFVNLIKLYSLFDGQLSLKLTRDTAQVSLCSWFMSGEGVDIVCKAAQRTLPDGSSGRPQFNEFVDMVVEASLQVLSPLSINMLLARSLASQEKYAALMNLCSTYVDVPAALRPVVTFYEAIAFSGAGKPLKAMTAFNSAAHAITEGNHALLRAMSPIGQKPEQISVGDYYIRALLCLQKHRHSEEVIEMARSAIASLPPGHECTSRIYTILFNHLVNQGNWTDALNSIIQNTDQELKRTTLRELISRMLHCHDWQSIVDLIYGKLEEEVENVLLAAARAQKATASPHLFKLVYSFYIKRNDFENAARAQYEYAFVLRTQAEQTPELLRRRRDALAVASTLLELLPQEDRYLSFPDELLEEDDSDTAMESTNYITEDMIDVAMRDVIADELDMVAPVRTSIRRRMFILTAEKLFEEWVVANARVALLVTGEVPPCEPSEIVNSLINIKSYDMAFDVCRYCNIPVGDVLSSLTRECLLIDANPPDVLPAWIQANQRRSEKIGTSSRWAVVRGLLAAARRLWPDDSRPLRAVTRTFLAHGIPIPCWLDAEYTERDVGGYLRCLIEYGAVSDGLKVAASCVDEETKKIKSIDSRVWLPLTAISDVLSMAAKSKEEKLLSVLNEKLRTHFTRVEGFEKAAQLSH